MSIVLMYHAVFADGDSQSIDPEDLPYAVSESDFTRQLDALAEKSVGLYDGQKLQHESLDSDDKHRTISPDQVVITFDDGHLSNLKLAAPLLAERNLPAYFFITSDFINHRRGFLSSDELAALAQIPNVCIGSHGKSHRFFDDMTSAESSQELLSSRQLLEAWTGVPVVSLSFPGGRFKRETLSLMAASGYAQWFGSEIGLVHDRQFLATTSDLAADTNVLRVQRDTSPLCRVPVRRNTQMTEFRRIINQDPVYFKQKRVLSQVKHVAQKVLGNRLYHGLYKSISAR